MPFRAIRLFFFVFLLDNFSSFWKRKEQIHVLNIEHSHFIITALVTFMHWSELTQSSEWYWRDETDKRDKFRMTKVNHDVLLKAISLPHYPFSFKEALDIHAHLFQTTFCCQILNHNFVIFEELAYFIKNMN